MATTSHATMHHDHRLWESEIGLWRDNLRAWQHEAAEAVSGVKKLEESLKKHEEALRTHAAAIRLAEQEFDVHEHALAEYEKGGAGEELIPMAKKHLDEAAHQESQRAAHEMLKQRHYAVMSHWQTLLNTLAGKE
jgi:hypothetical protein